MKGNHRFLWDFPLELQGDLEWGFDHTSRCVILIQHHIVKMKCAFLWNPI